MTDRPPPFDPVLGGLPRVDRRLARLAARLRRAGPALRPLVDELEAMLGAPMRLDEAELVPRPSGLRRPGAIAHCSWPRLGTRVGLGIEPSLAHAIVDRLLGFDRREPEHKLQVSPVEWGVLGFLVARALARLAERPGPLGPWDLFLDRIGPDPFPLDGLGSVVTLAWPLRVGPAAGVVRVWIPEVVVGLALVDEPPPPPLDGAAGRVVRRLGVLRVPVAVVLGELGPPADRGALVAGAALPLAPLVADAPGEAGEPALLVVGDARDPGRRPRFVGRLADPTRTRVALVAPIPRPPEPPAMPDVPPVLPPSEAPVRLAVELARLDLSLARLADLRPGDVLDLGREPDDPVTITSGGVPVARGTLVRLDEGLGVRITNVFI